MHVTAWNNGGHFRSGRGYGLRLRAADRDTYFRREWSSAFLHLPGVAQEIEANLAKRSFWSGRCTELLHAEIGRWLYRHGLAPWPKGKPPRFELLPTGGNRFRVEELLSTQPMESQDLSLAAGVPNAEPSGLAEIP
jgi:hypothetical protein